MKRRDMIASGVAALAVAALPAAAIASVDIGDMPFEQAKEFVHRFMLYRAIDPETFQPVIRVMDHKNNFYIEFPLARSEVIVAENVMFALNGVMFYEMDNGKLFIGAKDRGFMIIPVEDRKRLSI
jgi:hypothetical protein